MKKTVSTILKEARNKDELTRRGKAIVWLSEWELDYLSYLLGLIAPAVGLYIISLITG